ncbi:MAG: acyl-CoA/acyl-ACP dehydrogenase [Theionarchaea archaeon]|nr:acyl-CoA/acyl-ACP dehydrogenase [Theionarchaea archaeon]MBU7000187.1 acyl-CoA/acyl-ACP dehydrogenase [Theionarchaea archaeon]MBU7020904.1 acyl-CoA/acyl-ACP dehydrogenase [Theionarchaea archaeon]MBU7033956.1 acyl-CoA/acyl-ACP dehydrogenase [Theionarchaea archaeon]MBU7040548.1 acyl-CoA/acyl-ACP dehydrogenase [Theionarchaea archaeon]
MIEAFLTEPQKNLRDEVRDFVKWVPRRLLLDMDSDKVTYPREYVTEAARRNLLGLRFDNMYDGRGLQWQDEIVALEEVGILGASLACLYSLASIVGEALHTFGSEQQKQTYLKPLIRGDTCCAEALTEPRGGSDFFGTTTEAVRKGDHYILNGQKRFVVGAEGADIFLVYARTGKGDPRTSLSTFIVERDMGVKVEYLYGLMGTRGGGAGRLVFKDTEVPAENLLYGEGKGSDIFYQMMIPERMTSAAGALGLARAALETAARYSDRRKAFGQTIRKFEGVSFKVADSITLLDAASGLVHGAAVAVDRHGGTGYTRRLVSEAKKCATDTAWKIVNHAMQILGGIGYTNVYPIERMLRDARLMMIWTGTNEVMNLIIQHEYYREVLSPGVTVRNVEMDAQEADADEKIYE